MKFSCERTLLSEGLSIAGKAVSGKSSLTILEGVLLEAKDESLTLCGFDLQLGIRTSMACRVDVPGSLVLSAKVLSDIVRKMEEEFIHFETEEEGKVTIRCGRTVFNLLSMPAEEYPSLPEVRREKGIAIPVKSLKELLEGTLFSVSENQAKPIHTGCLFEREGKTLRVVAVDGYRLSIRSEALEGEGDDFSFVVPAFALKEIERLIREPMNDAIIYPDDKHILFCVGSAHIITRLLEGEFLDYKQAVPKTQQYEIELEAATLASSFERVSLLINERLKTPVRLLLEGSVMQLSCVTTIGKAYDEITFDGMVDVGLEIGFNHKFVLDALRACSEDRVVIDFGGSLNPMVIRPKESQDYAYMILPVRLRNE